MGTEDKWVRAEGGVRDLCMVAAWHDDGCRSRTLVLLAHALRATLCVRSRRVCMRCTMFNEKGVNAEVPNRLHKLCHTGGPPAILGITNQIGTGANCCGHPGCMHVGCAAAGDTLLML